MGYIHRRLSGLIAIMILASAVHADPAWMPDFDSRMAAPGKSREALTLLESLPIADRQSAEYHWALATVYRALEKPAPAAEALATYSLLQPTSQRDVIPLHSWLNGVAQKS